MTVKEYLSQAFEIEKHMKSKTRQIQKLRDMQEDIGKKLAKDKVQASCSPDKLGKLSDSIMDLESAFADDLISLMTEKNKIKKVISEVKNTAYQNILEERYVNLKDWVVIAIDNGYSERRVYDFHGEALTELTSKILQQYFDNI